MRLMKLSLPAIGLIVAAPAYSADAKWHIRQGAVICSSYFAVGDGQAAGRRGDAKWQNEVGCSGAAGPFPLTILETPTTTMDMIKGVWRVRLHLPDGNDATVYTSALNVMGRADNGAGPMRYIDVHNKNNDLLRSQELPKAPQRSFGELMKNLADAPTR
jgi:hypothetical protein